MSILQPAYLAISLYVSQWYWKQPYHNLALSGEAWVEELIYGHCDIVIGHSEHIHNYLRMGVYAVHIREPGAARTTRPNWS